MSLIPKTNKEILLDTKQTKTRLPTESETMTRKLITNLGDADPIEHGGFFVFETEDEEIRIEMWVQQDEESSKHLVYEFDCERCTYGNGVLSDNKSHPEISAWFGKPKDLERLADCFGTSPAEFIFDICSDDPIRRAMAWRMVGEYFGYENLDSEPLKKTSAELRTRLSEQE